MAERTRPKKRKPTAMLSCLTRMKSRMASIGDAMLPCTAIYARFCQETTLHGLKHTVEPKLHWLERVLWFVLTLCAFAGAVYCALNQLSRYTLEPVVVSMQRDYRRWRTSFPAVTACFIERIQPEKMQETIFTVTSAVQYRTRFWMALLLLWAGVALTIRYWNVTEESDPEKYQYYSEFIELVADVSFRENLQNFWKYQADETVQGIDLLELAMSVHPSNLLRVMTSQHDRRVHWDPVMTEVGMCLTFNSQYAEYQYMLQDLKWQREELVTCHYHSGQCFVRIDSIRNAVRYFIHSPFEISTAISNPTGEVSPGEELIIDFKAIEIQASPSVKRLKPEQRRCRYPDEWLSDSIRAYSFALCQMHCRSQMAVMFCGCRPYFHIKGDGDICDAHGMACIGRNVEILINIPKNLAKCSCLPQCAEVNYYSHTKKIVVSNASTADDDSDADADSQASLAALRINMLPPKFRLNRDVIFTLEDLFASLGGTTALFVGASVLTVVETGLFIIRHVVGFLIDRIAARVFRIQYNP